MSPLQLNSSSEVEHKSTISLDGTYTILFPVFRSSSWMMATSLLLPMLNANLQLTPASKEDVEETEYNEADEESQFCIMLQNVSVVRTVHS